MSLNQQQAKALKIEVLLRQLYARDYPTASEIREKPYEYIDRALMLYEAEDSSKRGAIEVYRKKYKGLINNNLDSLIETEDADEMISDLEILLS